MIETLQRQMYWSAFEDLFENGNGVTRRVVPARKDKHNPVLEPEMPWEGKQVIYPTVRRSADAGCWQMWYRSDNFLCYAESPDGAHWQRPSLGRVEFKGGKDNNIVYDFSREFSDNDGPCVYFDAEAESAERYKLCFSSIGRDRTAGGIHLCVSPNGLDWRIKKSPIIAVRNDSQCTFFRDPATKQYMVYHRPNFIVRTITKSVSADLLHWEGHNHWLRPDPHDIFHGHEPYALAVFPHDGHFLGFLKVYATPWYDRRCWIELAVCRNDFRKGPGSYGRGEWWLRPTDRTPLIGLGDLDDWDNFLLWLGHGLVADDDGYWYYYAAHDGLHTKTARDQPHFRGRIGRAYIGRRRFFEWYADETPSWLRTKPLLFEGETLTVDYDAGAGTIRASVLAADGATPDGYGENDSIPLTGSASASVIQFRGGSLQRFHGQPIHLVFHMQRRARLYAFGVL
ncbi:MAG: hypothetical protein HY360_19555 [Verrucomicrobia bacterium]|nr:hypothetical protein [Verrucomicrobiota bacterium]